MEKTLKRAVKNAFHKELTKLQTRVDRLNEGKRAMKALRYTPISKKNKTPSRLALFNSM